MFVLVRLIYLKNQVQKFFVNLIHGRTSSYWFLVTLKRANLGDSHGDASLSPISSFFCI